jgi:hypothetical protein
LLGQTAFLSHKLLLLPIPSQSSIEELEEYIGPGFADHFMIWNLSERAYDSAFYREHVIDNVFVGHPNPPLKAIFAILKSINAWLGTDEQNIAALCCQGNRSRSLMVAACYLAWSGKEFTLPRSALQRLCISLRLNHDIVMLPSQLRYLDYVNQVINGVEPVLKRVRLDRAILNCVPRSETGWIRPIMQIFKDSKLIYSTTQE